MESLTLLLVAWSGAERYSHNASSPSLSSRQGYLSEKRKLVAGEFGRVGIGANKRRLN